MELRQDIVPRIGDGEVGELNLPSLEELSKAMANGEVKPTCNMTYLAFLIRHGYFNAETEPALVEICSRAPLPRHVHFVRVLATAPAFPVSVISLIMSEISTSNPSATTKA